MMNKQEKFDLALDIYTDIDAIHNGEKSDYMKKVKEFLFDALEDKVTCETRLETTNEYVYVVYMLYKGQASSMLYITDSFESAKNYIYKEIKDEEINEGENYKHQLDNIAGLTFEEYKDNNYFYDIVLDDELGYGYAFGSEKKNMDINGWDLD